MIQKLRRNHQHQVEAAILDPSAGFLLDLTSELNGPPIVMNQLNFSPALIESLGETISLKQGSWNV